MYKVLFVDDEVLIREAVAENTPWEEAGFTLIGTAENGRKAVEAMERETPDLLITDICMPVMDGLALSGYVREHYPDTEVIILSGYDDFVYAKQAMRYAVSDYILKPITSLELREELVKTARKLDARQNKSKQFEQMKQEYLENIPVLREHLLNRLLGSTYALGDVEAQMEAYGIHLAGSVQSVLLFGVSDSRKWEDKIPDISRDLIDFIIFNIAEELVRDEENVLIFRDVNNRCIMIAAADTEKALEENIIRTGDRIRESIRQYTGADICIVVGRAVHSYMDWHLSYQNAKYAVEYQYLFADGDMIFGRDFRSRDGETVVDVGDWTQRFVLLIKTAKRQELQSVAHTFFETLQEARCTRQTLQLHVQRCVLEILITLQEAGTITKDDYEEESGFINSLQEYSHLSEIEEKFIAYCLVLTDGIAKKWESSNQAIAISALEYIGDRYMDPDISLNTVCEYLNLSVSYFSMVFKSSTKETFVEALTRIRMEKARKLLETTNLKSYEVALKTGYKDPHYFSSIFKKQTGKTPTEYAREMKTG